MRKIITFIITMFFSTTIVSAESLNKTISNLGINKSAISVSVKNIKNGEKAYSLNDRVPRMPASTLKILTTSAAYDTLGKDYKYETTFYKSTNNDVYLKLSADPYFTTSDLETLIEAANSKNISPKNFYIVDNVFDNVEWGEGWQWDDELNPLMPKFSVYNIDNNQTRVDIVPSTNGNAPKITLKPFYPYSFVNEVISNSKSTNSVQVSKNNSFAPNMLNLQGTVSKKISITLPVLNPKTNFILRLEEVINSKKFDYYDKIRTSELPDKNIYLISKVEHDASEMLPDIIKGSSNYVAETIFKTAGSVYANSKGTTENSLLMLNKYIEKIGLNSDDIKVVDGSGVSKNNLMTSKFMTEFLEYKSQQENFEEFKALLTSPGEGTLKNRMLYFKDNLKAKTGTLSDNSAIAGYLTTKRGNTYAFDIMINDAKTSTADKKNIEEQILRNIYLNY